MDDLFNRSDLPRGARLARFLISERLNHCIHNRDLAYKEFTEAKSSFVADPAFAKVETAQTVIRGLQSDLKQFEDSMQKVMSDIDNHRTERTIYLVTPKDGEVVAFSAEHLAVDYIVKHYPTLPRPGVWLWSDGKQQVSISTFVVDGE